MEKDIEKIKIVILAGGKGKRMESDLPKVLAPLGGKPMISHVLSAVSGFTSAKPVSIVGHMADLVQDTLGDLSFYSFQKEQLGTGHAVSCARGECGDAEHVVVLSGDQPFITAETIQRLISEHLTSGAKVTLTTTQVQDFEDWRKGFQAYGRIIRDDSDNLVEIKEYKDATEKERNIKEVNAGCYIFDAEWLWKNLEKIKNENAQKEYYLTDLLRIAKNDNEKIASITIDSREALGANTKEELQILEKLLTK